MTDRELLKEARDALQMVQRYLPSTEEMEKHTHDHFAIADVDACQKLAERIDFAINTNCKRRRRQRTMPRFKYIFDFRVDFWTWDAPLGAQRIYYDGWNNWVNFGFICFSWMTPSLKADEYKMTQK